jgi:NAD-dependent SIR2 family protein deacetylase
VQRELSIQLTRVKCKKCQNVFEQGFGGAALAPHIGPLHYVKCPACGKRSWLNIYSSVKDPLTWPPEEAKQQAPASVLTEEELEQKRIEESKYEKT